MGKIVNAIKPKVTIYETDKKDVQWAMHESTLAGPLGALPGIADMAAITGIWAILLHLMAKNHGINLTKEKSRELCECIFKGVIKYIAGCKAATQLVNLVPGAGTLIAVAGSTFENVVFTYRFARAVTDTMLTDKMDGFGGTAERVIKNFAYELCAADMDEMVKIYFMPGGDFAEFANNAKELAIDTATYVGDTLLTGVETIVEGTKKAGTAIVESQGFKNVQTKVEEVTENVVELAIDTAFDIGDTLLVGAETIVEGTKKAGKAIKDFFGNW